MQRSWNPYKIFGKSQVNDQLRVQGVHGGVILTFVYGVDWLLLYRW
jgi:hypothetical protein